jgi:pimeloyl-ACP methyl ester carboxylesterase
MQRADLEKPPLLLIHGACSQPDHMEPWRVFFAAEGYTCAVPALPGHAPSDPELLRRLGIDDFFAAVSDVLARFERPPIVIGHSMGGLLVQMLAAAFDCAAIVLVGSLAPGGLPAPPGAIPYYLRVGPRILAGLPFSPSRAGLSRLVLHDLPAAEREALSAGFVPESGLAYREMLFGKVRVKGKSVACPVLVVNGGADRLVPPSVGGEIARKYRAELTIIPGHGHWLIAGSLIGSAAIPVLRWIEGLSARSEGRPARPSFR